MSRSGPRALTIALLLSACAPPAPVTITPTAGPPTETPAATATQALPSPTPTASDTPVSIPPGVPQLDGALRSLATRWRPDGEALVLEQPGDQGGRLLTALPLDGSPPVPLVAFEQGESTGWDVRRDGGALAISILDARGTSARIAVWDGSTATARWATPAEAGVLHTSPLWSADGRSIYYSAIRPPDDLGFFRVGAAGLAPTRVKAPEGAGGTLQAVTPDGSGLVWSRVQAGGSAEVFDLRSGRNTSLDPNAAAQAMSWREAQPRGLVIKGGCCAGGPAGTLYVWDDRAGAARAIFGKELAPNDGVSAAAWDPEGKRIVAAVWDFALSREIARSLVVMDENGGARRVIPDTADALAIAWARAGILFTRPGGGRSGGHGTGTEIVLVDGSGGVRQFYRGPYVVGWSLVSP